MNETSGNSREPFTDALRQAQEQRLLAAWRPPSGWRRWSEVNNTLVGGWYTNAAFLFFLFGGALALLMRAQLATPDNDLVSADFYNQLFTMHGSVMMFLFAVPIFEAFSIQILPQMLGTRDLPFPRLSAFGFWCFAIGGVFVCGSIFFNAAPRGGWFMYPPLATAYQEGIGNDIWLLGLSFIEIAALAAAVELIVGVLRTRPPGMRIDLMPLYAWYILVVACMILFAFPPLIAGDILFELERAFDWPFFDAARGGDPLLWQHLFWIFGHPEVYIIFLPAVALVAMIVPTFSRRPVVGYSWVVLSAVGVGFLSFGLWVHHMYATGLPAISLGFFSAASEAVAIPTAVQIFCFIATVYSGKFVRSVPMLFVAGALAIFVLGGLTGVMVAVAPFDFQAHDTYFIVAHLHYVLIGGMLFPVAAGVYYYYPFKTGKLLSEKAGRAAFWLMFTGFNTAFLPMHFTGLLGMPRRVYTYPAGIGFDALNLVSTIGAFILAAGILVLAWDIVRPARHQAAPRNPWNAGTLEWLTPLPSPNWGVRSIPEVHGRYPLWDQPDLARNVDEGRYYLPDAEEGRRETLLSSPLDAHPEQCLRVAGPSFLPLAAAVCTGAFFIAATYKWYVVSGLSLALALLVILVWLWTGTGVIPEKPLKNVGMDLKLPLYATGPRSAGWWAVCITMIGDMSAFFSLVFGYFFFWTVHENFPPDPAPGPGVAWPLLALALTACAWALTLFAARCNRRNMAAAFYGTLGAAALLTICGALALLAGPHRTGLDPTRHVYPAAVWVLVIWSAIHLAVGLIMQLYCLARRLAECMNAEHDAEMRNITLYWHFLMLTVTVTVAVIAGFPELT